MDTPEELKALVDAAVAKALGRPVLTDEQRAEVNAAVAKGIDVFEKLERRAKEDAATAAELDDVFDAMVANGVISENEATAYKWENRALHNRNRADRIIFHHKLTRRAVDKGVDVPQNQRDGGGTR